jgi:hypothetical protein
MESGRLPFGAAGALLPLVRRARRTRRECERYVIYRVADAAGVVPQIRRVADPMRMIKEGKGRLLLDRAQMVLAFSGDEGGGGET